MIEKEFDLAKRYFNILSGITFDACHPYGASPEQNRLN